MHTICRFEAREVRSRTLQMVCKLEVKRRNDGRFKTTTSSCAEISQPKAHFAAAKWNPLAKFRKVFRRCETHIWHTSAISQPMPPSSHLRTMLQNHLQAANEVETPPPSCETSCKSSPSCGITSKLQNHKFNLEKWTIQRVKSTCAISDICYRLSFFLKIFCVNFYFLLVISQRYYWDIS